MILPLRAVGKPAWETKNYQQVYKEYFKKYAFKHPRSEDFIKLVEETSKLDLTAFKNQWLYGKGLPYIIPNRIKLAQYGISVNEIMEIINFAIGGSPITYSIFRLCSTKRNL